MSFSTAVDHLLSLFQVEAQPVISGVRFLLSLIMFLALPSLDVTADKGRLDFKCHCKTNDVILRPTPEYLSRFSAEMRSFINPHFLAWITAITLFVLWSAIILYSAKQLPKIRRTTVYSEKEHLCHEFWKKFCLHVYCETVVIAVSLVLLWYTQRMYLTENIYYCPLKNVVTCSIVHLQDKANPLIVIIGVIWVFILALGLWTIYDAIYNKEEFIKNLVNSATGNEEGKERLEINAQPLK